MTCCFSTAFIQKSQEILYARRAIYYQSVTMQRIERSFNYLLNEEKLQSTTEQRNSQIHLSQLSPKDRKKLEQSCFGSLHIFPMYVFASLSIFPKTLPLWTGSMRSSTTTRSPSCFCYIMYSEAQYYDLTFKVCSLEVDTLEEFPGVPQRRALVGCPQEHGRAPALLLSGRERGPKRQEGWKSPSSAS